MEDDEEDDEMEQVDEDEDPEPENFSAPVLDSFAGHTIGNPKPTTSSAPTFMVPPIPPISPSNTSRLDYQLQFNDAPRMLEVVERESVASLKLVEQRTPRLWDPFRMAPAPSPPINLGQGTGPTPGDAKVNAAADAIKFLENHYAKDIKEKKIIY
ncbi:hypothetical protein H1R20_g2406, partial [Candolleomyces eurysporus]